MPRTTGRTKRCAQPRALLWRRLPSECSAHRGFAATNVRQIAAEAGVSTGSIYRHYASKEELFDELIEQASRGLVAVTTLLSTEGDPLSMIRSFTEVYVADLAANNGAAEFYMVINQGFTTDTPEGTAARLAATQGALWRAFALIIGRGQAAGQITAETQPEWPLTTSPCLPV